MTAVTDQGVSLLVDLAKSQLEGKNKAIHAYDQMIWTVRSGFVTLFFVGWGFLFKDMLGITPFRSFHLGVVLGLLCVSVALALAADRVERNYVRRKFRVIRSVNRLLEALKAQPPDADLIREELRIAGDTDDPNYAISGFSNERAAGLWIYRVSIGGLLIGLLVVWIVAAFGPIARLTPAPPAQQVRAAAIAPC